MSDFLQRLKQRKLVQWAVAYVAFAFALIQVADVVAGSYHWSDGVMHLLFGLLVLGFIVALLLAWYHGEQGRQRASGTELLLIALVLAVGGGLLWHFARVAPTGTEFETNTAIPAHHATSAAVPASSGAAQASGVAVIPAKSIAVLPFENLSSDKDNAYFSDGMQDLILTKLADIGQLKVISRTSTMKYASHPDDLKTIAQQLGVATILEGSVQKAGNQVLINVQLIDAKTDAHLWAESYTRTLDNVFGVEGEVAGQIATALKAKLSPTETQSLATALSADTAANDLYLRGEYFYNQGRMNYDTALTKQAIDLYRQAIAKAPSFALARARLSSAETYLGMIGGGGEDIQQLKSDARAQAEQALALAPDLVEAQLAIGGSDFWDSGDGAAALKIYAAVLKAHPNDVGALEGIASVLVVEGHFADATTASQKAFTLDPRNSSLARVVGQIYMVAGRYSEAKAALQHAMALDPNNMQAKLGYSESILFASGNVAAALAAAQGDSGQLPLWRVSLLTYQRKYPDALALLASIPDTADNFSGTTKSLQQAELYRLSGDAAHAKSLYEQTLPLLRAQLKRAAGSDTTQGEIWASIATAELGLGHTAAGMTAIAQSQALTAHSKNIIGRLESMEGSASLYAQAGRPDLAVPLLDKALATSGIGLTYSPVMLWVDPAWDPIRRDPRFQALLKKYASAAPAVADSGVAHD